MLEGGTALSLLTMDELLLSHLCEEMNKNEDLIRSISSYRTVMMQGEQVGRTVPIARIEANSLESLDSSVIAIFFIFFYIS